ETEREPDLSATYLIGPLSTIDPAPRGQVILGGFGADSADLPAAYQLVVPPSSVSYLSAQGGCRNRGAPPSNGTWPMTTFDKREEGFEKKFALDEELKFKAEARRNKLFGLWVAGKLGLSGDAATAYAKEVVAAEFEGPGRVAAKI